MFCSREGRGRQLPGHRRLSLAAAAMVCACALPSAAVGASGGGGVMPGKSKKNASARAHTARYGPFRGRGMWIWYVSQSNGGDVGSIISTAHRRGISVLMIKSGDGSGTWDQFSSGLVSRLHRAGIRVCGWQYVYGTYPSAEAQVGATAVRRGADCLLIDAESEYEGRYISAQTYIRTLRHLIGARFPVALASFPYVDYHPSFPYSVFMGPGGAQYNVPQMYWYDIGVSVDDVYAHTYFYNRPYARSIFPLGQLYNNPPASQIRRFRADSLAYGAHGVSWWDWQETPGYGWNAISGHISAPKNFAPVSGVVAVRPGDQSDLVIWAQEHLVSAGYHIGVDGNFGPATERAVRRFQAAHGIPRTGVIGTRTWRALLRYRAANVTWTSGGARLRAHVAGSFATGSGGALILPPPKNAHLPAVRYEIPRGIGAH